MWSSAFTGAHRLRRNSNFRPPISDLAMTAALSNKARAEPNLTPILDMVFQLITFFMLVINFKANMIDKRMELPVVGSARPMAKEDKRPFLMVNLNDKGEFTVLGRRFGRQIPGYIDNASRTTSRRLGALGKNIGERTTNWRRRSSFGPTRRPRSRRFIG